MWGRRRSSEDSNGGNEGTSWGALAAGAAGLAAAIGGAMYLHSKIDSTNTPHTEHREWENLEPPREDKQDFLSDLFSRMGRPNPNFESDFVHVSTKKPSIKNLNALLDYIYSKYVALKDDEFETYYKVFIEVFNQLHKKMKKVDVYYNRYSSTVQLAGSHLDRLRISKPDEFDVNILIGIPANKKVHPDNPKESDIVFEPREIGYIELRMGSAFKRNIQGNHADWHIHETAFKWIDKDDFLLNSEFMNWFKGVVDRALNLLPEINCGGVPYKVRKSESGPALTLIIENLSKGVKIDVDLVPALKFPEERWPITKAYRPIPHNWSNPEKNWLVVPKPNKSAQHGHGKCRSWRLGLQVQEKKLMHNTGNMRQVIRLLKKLRDSQNMKKLASYYLKTLVLLEAVERENEPGFWTQNLAQIFIILVKKLHDALLVEKIPYFWSAKQNCNLLDNIPSDILRGYTRKLGLLIQVLEDPTQYREVARYLLTTEEFMDLTANVEGF